MTVLNFAKALRLGGQLVNAVHLDRHRVYPLPSPFLEPPVGQVSTPDTPADYLDSSVRFRAKVRLDSVPTAVANVAWQRATGAANIAWDWYTDNLLRLRWRVSTTGTGLILSSTPLPDGSLVPGTDQYIGTRFERTVDQDTVVGEMSLDGGATWTQITNVPRTSIGPVFDSTAPIIVGALASGGIRFPGRIYWALMEAINRAQLILPGVPGNLLSVPDSVPLNVIGDFEMVALVTRPDWAATYANIVTKDSGSPRGFLIRVAFSAINFAVPTVDGSSQSTVNSANIGGVNGQPLWIRVTRVAATGLCSFYSAPYQPTEPTTWTARGTASTPAGAMPANTSPVQIGARGTTAIEPWLGRIARVILRDVIGTAPQLVFPGAIGNYLTVPLFWTGAHAGIEITQRLSANWATPVADFEGSLSMGSTCGIRRTATAFQWYVYDAAGVASTASTALAQLPAWTNGQMIWIRATVSPNVTWQWAPDSPTEPTVWTDLRAPFAPPNAGIRPSTNNAVIGSDTGTGTSRMWQGRIARTIVRDGVGGPVLLDVDEANVVAGYLPTFTATTGQTVTETGNVIRGRVLDVTENNAWVATAPSRPYLNPAVGSVYTDDAPDLTITGDIRVTAYLRDDSVESAGSRYWVAKFAAPSDYAYSILATYLTYQYATQGWPTGAATPAGSLVMGSRTQFGTTPPGADVYLRADITGVNPNSQALTNTAKGYTSTDGVAWTPAGTPPTPSVRADAMTRDAVARLRLGFGALGRLYWVQVENINRARLMFPGPPSGLNYLETPDAAALDITGDIEIVLGWIPAIDTWIPATTQEFIGKYVTTGNQRSWRLLQGTTGNLQFVTTPDGVTTTSPTTPSKVTTGHEWLKVTRNATTGATNFYSAPGNGTSVEPTVWTPVGGTIASTPGLMFAGTAPLRIGNRQGVDPATGRLRRAIIRNGIGGPVVFDVRGDDAGAMGAGTTFPATSGQVVTVSQDAPGTVVQPQPDALVWRFDASEAPAGVAAYTDPRGRAWSIEPAAAIVSSSAFTATSGQPVTAYSTPGAAQIVQRQPDATIWRFDANEWPGGASSVLGADGRTWTATNPDALAHPASQPD